jgi:hypothetical protein
MSRLFTYIIPTDDGAAPNPFGGMCTLAICKPGIRRVAQEGDWVAGVGSKKGLFGDLSNHLVYAMRVEEVLPLEEYDRQAPTRWPHRIPNVQSPDLWGRLGDCIYDFSNGKPLQPRPSVHGSQNVETDLSGKNVLISHHFYYWGAKAIDLPSYLQEICPQTRGHRSDSNAPYFNPFVTWLSDLGLLPGQMYGWPDFMINWSAVSSCGGCSDRRIDGENDTSC